MADPNELQGAAAAAKAASSEDLEAAVTSARVERTKTVTINVTLPDLHSTLTQFVDSGPGGDPPYRVQAITEIIPGERHVFYVDELVTAEAAQAAAAKGGAAAVVQLVRQAAHFAARKLVAG